MRVGIIPARAGFTRPRATRAADGPDHPRSRGVYEGGMVPNPGWWGSSPLARGLPRAIALDRGALRIIPARAGFT